MEWHPFFYKGEETNIEVNELGEIRRVYKEWLKNNRKNKYPKIYNWRGYDKVNFSSKIYGVTVYPVHKIMAIVFLNHNPCGYKLVIDHIDGNTKNNALSNLREVTHRENMINRKNKSIFGTGIYQVGKKYSCEITFNSKVYKLGIYKNIEKANQIMLAAYESIKSECFKLWYKRNKENYIQEKQIERNQKTKNKLKQIKGYSMVSNSYFSRITYNRKSCYIGCYSTAEDAAQAYQEAKKQIEAGTFQGGISKKSKKISK